MPTYLLARVTTWVVVPRVALYVLLFGAQRFLADELALDDDTPYIEPSLLARSLDTAVATGETGTRWDGIDRITVDNRDAS
ncbi:hypothetical protein GA0070613_4642 [Micromonospora inositola]|uniref:Uncharacterized protein n=1 Tax=Micromonospora inositola TaxID=47865 RepID=A0A1C5JH64_9ACTN|nr:hypothetical protein GA0070613_4642 [Micromonospora inositola]